jgi:phage terminase small subunit
MTNKTIDEKACRLAGNDKIQARLQELTDKFANRNFVTVEKVLAELAKVAFAISAGKESIEIKMNDKIKALELMGKHLGMFTDKVEIGNKDGRPFRTEEVGKLTDEELDKRIQALMEVR